MVIIDSNANVAGIDYNTIHSQIKADTEVMAQCQIIAGLNK